MRILVLSDIFPNPANRSYGIFVERQVFHLQGYCENVVIVPIRVFPHLRIWKKLLCPKQFIREYKQIYKDIKIIPKRDDLNGIPVYYPRYTSLPKQIFHGLWGFFAYPFLRKLLHSLNANFNFDLIHAHFASPSGVIAILAKKWMKVPVIVTVHGMDVSYVANQIPFGRAVVSWVFRHADFITANSCKTMNQILQHGGDPKKTRILRLGGDAPTPFLNNRKNNIAAKYFRLLTVGDLKEQKGHRYVLEAVRELCALGYSIRYVIVGDGPERQHLEYQAKIYGLNEVVRFEGQKTHEEVWQYFSECDVFVLPSWSEAFGVVYVEALGIGKPVIGCVGEGGPEDLRSFGDCVELVKPRDAQDLAMAIKRLLDNPERRRQMGDIGKKIVMDHYTWNANATNTIQIYKEALGGM